jgi:hypothetical protein
VKQYAQNNHGDILVLDCGLLIGRANKPVTYYTPVLDANVLPWQMGLEARSLDIIEVVW